MCWKRRYLRQANRTTPIQFQQCHTATHFFQTPIPGSPLQLFTNLPRQLHPGKIPVTVDHLLNSCDHSLVDLLPANFHTGNLQIPTPPCPVKSYGTRSAKLGGGGPKGRGGSEAATHLYGNHPSRDPLRDHAAIMTQEGRGMPVTSWYDFGRRLQHDLETLERHNNSRFRFATRALRHRDRKSVV